MEKIGGILTAWQIWVIVGIVLCTLEIFAPGFFLMSLGVGCFIAGVSALVFGIKGQITFFIIGSIVSFFLARKLIYYNKEDDQEPQFGAKSMVGREGYVEEKVTDREGYVKIGGEVWPARSAGGEIEPGAKVKIERLEGNKFYVSELKD
jgi:membrane protein implicated in regulation of membrane protease activity